MSVPPLDFIPLTTSGIELVSSGAMHVLTTSVVKPLDVIILIYYLLSLLTFIFFLRYMRSSPKGERKSPMLFYCDIYEPEIQMKLNVCKYTSTAKSVRRNHSWAIMVSARYYSISYKN